MPRKRKAALPKAPAKKAKTAAPEDPPPKRGAGDAADSGALAEIAALMGLRCAWCPSCGLRRRRWPAPPARPPPSSR
ncbi:hypothetical protein DIPPA_29083 [Diplonema papillatum]|nr:hypothetical protein DIPPA_29090 [Diplonema papillatum]KAJ9448654.1 hypothetical protein DIPPA_29098 [Diplonema papillatum]KAJ9448655.1 hypothetical protein DIPPA_29083 [Diplonema papillatum]